MEKVIWNKCSCNSPGADNSKWRFRLLRLVAKIWQLSLIEQLLTITVQVSVLQNWWAKEYVIALQKLKFVVLLVCFLIKKLSNFNISTLQNSATLKEILREKGENDPLYVTVGCKVLELWPIKGCQNTGQNRNAHAQMEFLVISILNILKWLFQTKTKN